MFVYDVIANIKRFQQEIEGFDQIVDAGFMFDANTLVIKRRKKRSQRYLYLQNR